MAGRVTRPSSGNVLMQKRVGASILRSGWHTRMQLNKAKWSWPLGKLSLFRDRVEIKALFFRPLVLHFADVEIIRSSLHRVVIEHRDEQVPDFVALTGFGLLSGIREAVRRHNLPVKVSS